MKRNKWRIAIATLAVFALVAAACGGDDDDSTSDDTEAPAGDDDGGGEAAGTACMVSDTGGIDDRSFNQTSYDGVVQAEEDLGIEQSFLESTTDADYAPNIQTFIDQGCDIIITVGFLLGDATLEAATANPDQNFAIVDYGYEDPPDNILQLTFSTDQAAFLAGYLAAGMTESGKVGTFGGINIPTVTIFMDGLLAGVNYYNEQKGTAVEVLGWDGSDGLFTGDFEDQDKGAQTAQNLLDEGADIILPVAGPVGIGTFTPVREAGAKLIWVDTDGCVSAEDACDLFLTSVMKNMNVAVFDAIDSVVSGEFAGGLYSGTLENNGVAIAPYHDFETEIPDELKTEITDLQDAIISGEVTVGG